MTPKRRNFKRQIDRTKVWRCPNCDSSEPDVNFDKSPDFGDDFTFECSKCDAMGIIRRYVTYEAEYEV